MDPSKDNGPKLGDSLVLQEFKDVFLNDLHEFPSKRKGYFSINLAPRDIVASKTSHGMSTLELLELEI